MIDPFFQSWFVGLPNIIKGKEKVVVVLEAVEKQGSRICPQPDRKFPFSPRYGKKCPAYLENINLRYKSRCYIFIPCGKVRELLWIYPGNGAMLRFVPTTV